MTDSHRAPSPSSSANSPDQPESKKPAVSTVQVGASAAAAVTSAIAASFLGSAGTLIGAAVGSIVSTIAGALYADYLGRAGKRIAVTRDVVIQRIPSEVLATSPLRHLTGPADLPGRESLRPIGEEAGDETVVVPVDDATQLLRRPDGMAPLDRTTVIPAYGSVAAETAMQAAVANGSTTGTGRPASTRLPAGPPRPAEPRPWWKQPVVAMAAVALIGFLIALAFVLATEKAIGHPISGGTSGNSISNLGSTEKETKTEVTPTPTATTTPSASATATPSAIATTAAPTATATVAPTATSGATTAPVAPQATGTARATATGGTQETAAP